MSSTNYLTNTFARTCAMDEEALSAYNAVSVPKFFYVQEKFPYVTTRLGTTELSSDGEGFEIRVYQIIKRLVVGHADRADYTGNPEDLLLTFIPLFENFYAQRPMLTSTTYAADFDDLYPTGAWLTFDRAAYGFENSGIGAEQVGAEFILRVPFQFTMDQET